MRRQWAAVGIAVLVLTGCTAIRRNETFDTEQVLAASGFYMKLADTPEKLAQLQTLTPRKLVPHQRDGKLYFVYADPDFCKCLYAGTEQNYQEFQRLGLQKRLADEQLMAAQDNLYAPMNWGAWGYWPW
jgi:hypothetical protein